MIELCKTEWFPKRSHLLLCFFLFAIDWTSVLKNVIQLWWLDCSDNVAHVSVNTVHDTHLNWGISSNFSWSCNSDDIGFRPNFLNVDVLSQIWISVNFFLVLTTKKRPRTTPRAVYAFCCCLSILTLTCQWNSVPPFYHSAPHRYCHGSSADSFFFLPPWLVLHCDFPLSKSIWWATVQLKLQWKSRLS